MSALYQTVVHPDPMDVAVCRPLDSEKHAYRLKFFAGRLREVFAALSSPGLWKAVKGSAVSVSRRLSGLETNHFLAPGLAVRTPGRWLQYAEDGSRVVMYGDQPLRMAENQLRLWDAFLEKSALILGEIGGYLRIGPGFAQKRLTTWSSRVHTIVPRKLTAGTPRKPRKGNPTSTSGQPEVEVLDKAVSQPSGPINYTFEHPWTPAVAAIPHHKRQYHIVKHRFNGHRRHRRHRGHRGNHRRLRKVRQTLRMWR